MTESQHFKVLWHTNNSKSAPKELDRFEAESRLHALANVIQVLSGHKDDVNFPRTGELEIFVSVVNTGTAHYVWRQFASIDLSALWLTKP